MRFRFRLALLLLVAAGIGLVPRLRTGPPPAIEILPSPGAAVEARTIQIIEGARRSLHGALYELSLPAVAAALGRARARGVDVRLHLESDNRRERRERNCLGLLRAVGVPLTWDDRPTLMHDKFLIVDRRVVWTGSANLAWTGLHLHYDEAVVIRSRALAERYEAAFAALSAGEPPPDDPAPIPVGDGWIRVAFTPGPDRSALFLAAVAGAARRIRVAAFSLTYPPLVDALAERARQGLPVEVLLDRRLAHGPAARRAVTELAAAGCRVRFGDRRPTRDLLARFGLPRFQDVKLHDKLLAADDDVIVTGSANLSRNGMEHNDENVLWIQSRRVSQAYGRILEKIRDATSEQ